MRDPSNVDLSMPTDEDSSNDSAMIDDILEVEYNKSIFIYGDVDNDNSKGRAN